MFQEMEYICAIWDEKSFTRAAEKLFISQPALSAMVRRVETRWGIRIFDRGSKPISLTPAGEKYIESAEHILKIASELSESFRQLDDLNTGRVTIGTSDYFSSYYMPEILRDFRRHYPGIEVDLLAADPLQRNKLLREEVADVLISVENEIDKTTAAITAWKQEHLMLAVSRDHRTVQLLTSGRYTIADIKNGEHLHGRKDTISITAFSKERFLSLKKQNVIYDRTLKICRDAGFEPLFDNSASLQITAYHMVRAGLGVAFVREDLLRHVVDTNDVYLYNIDSPDVYRNICIALKMNRQAPPAVEAFYKFLRTR